MYLKIIYICHDFSNIFEIIDSIRKYNFWDGFEPALGYPRKAYTDHILPYIGNKLVKVIVGQRRTGKSHILRQIAARLLEQGVPVANICYINKEYIELKTVETELELQQLYEQYKAEFRP